MSDTQNHSREEKNGPCRLSDGDMLHIVQALTSQKTSIKLKHELKRLVEHLLTGSSLQVFEIRTVRDADWQKPDIMVSLDSLNPKRKVVEIKKLEGFEEAVTSKKIVSLIRDEGNRMIIPISASATSHVVVFDHQCIDEAAIEPLFYSFGNLLDLLRSRDRDPLTGFLNRYAFNRSMSEMTLNRRDNPDYAVDERPYTAMAMLDLDHFKFINDNYGHLIGDETLLIFSQEIRTVFRHTDIIARYGGEEFVVILKDVDAEKAMLVLDRCRRKIEERIFPQVEHITVSIGFAEVTDGSSPMLALDRADNALYYAKENGRNRVCSYEELVAEGMLSPIEEKGSDVELWD